VHVGCTCRDRPVFYPVLHEKRGATATPSRQPGSNLQSTNPPENEGIKNTGEIIGEERDDEELLGRRASNAEMIDFFPYTDGVLQGTGGMLKDAAYSQPVTAAFLAPFRSQAPLPLQQHGQHQSSPSRRQRYARNRQNAKTTIFLLRGFLRILRIEDAFRISHQKFHAITHNFNPTMHLFICSGEKNQPHNYPLLPVAVRTQDLNSICQNTQNQRKTKTLSNVFL